VVVMKVFVFMISAVVIRCIIFLKRKNSKDSLPELLNIVFVDFYNELYSISINLSVNLETYLLFLKRVPVVFSHMKIFIWFFLVYTKHIVQGQFLWFDVFLLIFYFADKSIKKPDLIQFIRWRLNIFSSKTK